jgi:phosphoesterase RecJ-like protein
MPDISSVVIFKNDDKGAAKEAVKRADIIFCLDFHLLSRLELLGELIDENQHAKRVLIDHHLDPSEDFDLMLSYSEASSTCYLVALIIEQLYGLERISRTMAENLFVGMMTDTGNFAFSTLTPDLFRMVAVLAATGISIPTIHNNVYNSFTEGRARLFGYVINRKMKIFHNGTVAHMSLTADELKRFWFQQGDSEGFVNYPLTIKKMKMSAIFTEHSDFIRVSLRSRGDIDVNIFAQRYFHGGGHKNAAGGKSFMSMDETIKFYEQCVKDYAAEGLLK